MDESFFVQLALSAAGVGVLVALAAWARISRPVAPLDEQRARAILAEEFPVRDIEGVWVAVDGAGALAKSGAMALVVCRVGDGFVARQIPWAQALAATFRNGRLSIDLSDISAPRAEIALPSWPPKDLAA